MTEVHDRDSRKVQGRHECLDVMMTVDEIRRKADVVQIGYDRNCRRTQLFRNLARDETKGNWTVPLADERAAHVTHPQLRPGPQGQRVIGEENGEAARMVGKHVVSEER